MSLQEREVTRSELVDSYCSCFVLMAGPRGGLGQGMGEQGHSQETIFIYLFIHVTSKGLGQTELGAMELRADQT